MGDSEEFARLLRDIASDSVFELVTNAADGKFAKDDNDHAPWASLLLDLGALRDELRARGEEE